MRGPAVDIHPAGMTLERALQIAVKAIRVAPPTPPSERQQELTRLHALGLNDKELAEALDCDRRWIRASRASLGLPANARPGGQPRPPKEETPA